jgi:CRP-like cAMP-binding protein
MRLKEHGIAEITVSSGESMLGVQVFMAPSRSGRCLTLLKGICAGQKGAVLMTYTGIHKPDEKQGFDVGQFLACAGAGRNYVHCDPKSVLFSQGDSADSVFYIQSGRVKVTVVSANGREATITLLSAGDFVGEESLTGADGQRSVTVTAITPCYAMKITRREMIRVMQDEHAFSDLFLSNLLARSIRTQADLVDQLFNCSERRLARILLVMAEYSDPGAPTNLIPPITQETLAEMVGTTRSRVSLFMNRFRRLGYIEYHRRVRVHKSRLNAVLLDRLPGLNPERPPPSAAAHTRSRPARRGPHAHEGPIWS